MLYYIYKNALAECLGSHRFLNILFNFLFDLNEVFSYDCGPRPELWPHYWPCVALWRDGTVGGSRGFGKNKKTRAFKMYGL